MPTSKSPNITSKLVHALRTDLTLYNFSETDSQKSETISDISKLLERTDLLVSQSPEPKSFEVVDLDEIVEESLEDLRFADRSRVQYTPLKAKVSGNRTSISRMIREIINNSLAYSNKIVYVSIHDTGQYAVIRVEDFGGGIPNNVQNHVGEPFVTSDINNSGHGLGLSLIWKIVQDHDGALTLITDGKGTTVIVTLNLV